ncbi:MAG TPA: hypothetical protein VFT89_07515 [Rhizobiaceae bacterium]|nr:hypothetical protein [Rhizobiaceae bacterium]
MLDRKQWHPSVTTGRIEEACERRLSSLDNPGICLACGFEQDGCEPDAREYECEACGEEQVFGCEELLMEIA